MKILTNLWSQKFIRLPHFPELTNNGILGLLSFQRIIFLFFIHMYVCFCVSVSTCVQEPARAIKVLVEE